MIDYDAPPINRVKVSWRYEGETDYLLDIMMIQL